MWIKYDTKLRLSSFLVPNFGTCHAFKPQEKKWINVDSMTYIGLAQYSSGKTSAEVLHSSSSRCSPYVVAYDDDTLKRLEKPALRSPTNVRLLKSYLVLLGWLSDATAGSTAHVARPSAVVIAALDRCRHRCRRRLSLIVVVRRQSSSSSYKGNRRCCRCRRRAW